ncbi:hypothetical protein BpHYR1_025488 [Brachionus plicatilis]|uniref:Uncharacterized protein n=1 Tax=Brachionus plicatilis TaxID=10195 RepID=A0A3M7PBZ7_BRAPC|nr:hypothetical protein BpHYR1_025488 [Brachionus plicatilis]
MCTLILFEQRFWCNVPRFYGTFFNKIIMTFQNFKSTITFSSRQTHTHCSSVTNLNYQNSEKNKNHYSNLFN